MTNDLPREVIDQLSAIPEDRPGDFSCVICGRVASNQWNHSPKNYERPPVCNSCESTKGYAWNGMARSRVKPSGGSFHDRRNAIRIDALADAIAAEAQRQQWEQKHAS